MAATMLPETPFEAAPLVLGTEVEEPLGDAELELSAVGVELDEELGVAEVEEAVVRVVALLEEALVELALVLVVAALVELSVLEAEVLVVDFSEVVVVASEVLAAELLVAEAEPSAPTTVKEGEKLYSFESLSSMISMLYFWWATRLDGTCQV